MALPTGGYSFTPQVANLGASPLSALKPLDVGVSVQFTPMPKYEVPSAQQELVSMGAAKGFQGLVEPVFAAFKEKQEEIKKKDEEALKFRRDLILAKVKAEKTPEEIAYEKARLENLQSITKERGGDKVPVKTRPAGSLTEEQINSVDTEALPEASIPSQDGNQEIDFTTPLFGSSEEIDIPAPDLSKLKKVGVLADSSFPIPSAVSTVPAEFVIPQEQINAVTNPPLAYMQASTEGISVPPVPAPSVTPEIRKAIPVTPQPTSFKPTPDQLAKLEESRTQMIEQATGGIAEQQPKQNVDEVVGELTDLPYESSIDARKAVTKIKKLLPNYKDAKITPFYDEKLGRRVFFVEQPEFDEKYVAPGTTPKLNKEQVGIVLSMQDNLRQDPLYSKAITFRDSKDTILTSLKDENGFSDITAINAFQRLIDPGVAVREGDVALLQSATALFNKYNPKFIAESFTKGSKLPPEDREKMRKLTMELTRMALEKANKEIIPRFTQMASDAGINPDYVIKEFDIPLDKAQLSKEIEDLKARMRAIPKSQANDPASKELINQYHSKKTQLLQAK
jgi:hypothetical protein